MDGPASVGRFSRRYAGADAADAARHAGRAGGRRDGQGDHLPRRSEHLHVTARRALVRRLGFAALGRVVSQRHRARHDHQLQVREESFRILAWSRLCEAFSDAASALTRSAFTTRSLLRMDGNGIMISGYNRKATVSHSVFRWIGDSVLAGWGSTDDFAANGTRGFDLTSGDFPRFTEISNNLIGEFGLFEKQSSAWFQAKTAQTTLKRNIIYNGPRAGVCVLLACALRTARCVDRS